MQVAKYKSGYAIATTLLVALLSGCASVPGEPGTAMTQAEQARRALAIGNYSEAAGLWQAAALAAAGARQHDYRLKAAEAWMQAGETESARTQLKQVEERQLATAGRTRLALLHAELALHESDAQTAEFYLRAAGDNMVTGQQQRYRMLLERLNRLTADPASYALATAAAALRSEDRYDAARGVAICQLLEEVPSGTLRNISPETGRASGLGNWPELCLRIRQALIGNVDLATAADVWAQARPGNEIDRERFLELAQSYRRLFELPGQIAVILPTQGGMAAAGKAIRDGLISAYFENPGNVTLRFYPSSNNPRSAISSYYQAMAEGAQWIIGPLRKSAVQAMANLSGLSLPVLALNSLEQEAPASHANNLFFSLSLSQEQEARAIARKALENGWFSAIMLSSDNPWGQRMEAAISEEFVAGGGSITASALIEPTANDHSELLTGMLRIDESIDRKHRVEATLGIPLSFEPTRRDDFDVFFLAASPAQGRQIRPQLRFHDAGDKPVLAMGRIYSGADDRTADRDLNGVLFPSTHWQLDASASSAPVNLSSLRGGSMSALHALGMDAWNILPWLPLMRKDPDLGFPGETGALFMGDEGQLLRRPAWASFSGGRPVPFEWPEPQD